MSRLARNPIALPSGVTAEVSGRNLKLKGPKGELSMTAPEVVAMKLEDGEGGKKQIKVELLNKTRETLPLWGTTWSHIRNRIRGVNEGYTKNLEIQGVGYRANVQGSNLVLQLGYSHDINFPIPQGIKIAVEKQTAITITGVDKELVSAVAAKIKSYRPPEPYKGKGIRYEGQYVLRKEGKKK